MGLKQTIDVLNRMEADRVIGHYAITGAVAALNYIEIGATEDLDILISFEDIDGKTKSGLLTLEPILSYLGKLGYTKFSKEGILIEGWPVQFLPIANDMDSEALETAEEIEIDLAGGNVKTRLLRAEYVVANALRIGRPKDRLRVLQFLESNAVDPDALCPIVERYGLGTALAELCRSTGLPNPCRLE